MDLNGSSVVLFPHSRITDRDLKKTITDFGQLTIFQPWFMHVSLPVDEERGLPPVRVLNPPLDMKPKGDFKGLLAEYRSWIRQHRDKGYVTCLNTLNKMDPSEDSVWNLRQMISRMGQEPSSPVNDRTLQWHLTLHLAREMEENRLDAEEMLNRVKQGESPLEEALEQEVSLEDLFKDLPPTEMQFLMDEHRYRQIFAAWFGLFGEYLPDHGLLLTLDPYVIDCATGLFEGEIVEPSGESEVPISQEVMPNRIHLRLTHLPRLSDDLNSQRDPVLTGLSGRTIILFED